MGCLPMLCLGMTELEGSGITPACLWCLVVRCLEVATPSTSSIISSRSFNSDGVFESGSECSEESAECGAAGDDYYEDEDYGADEYVLAGDGV